MTTDSTTTQSETLKKSSIKKKIIIVVVVILAAFGIDHVTFHLVSGGAVVVTIDSAVVAAPVVDTVLVKEISPAAIVDTAKKDTSKTK